MSVLSFLVFCRSIASRCKAHGSEFESRLAGGRSDCSGHPQPSRSPCSAPYSTEGGGLERPGTAAGGIRRQGEERRRETLGLEEVKWSLVPMGRVMTSRAVFGLW